MLQRTSDDSAEVPGYREVVLSCLTRSDGDRSRTRTLDIDHEARRQQVFECAELTDGAEATATAKYTRFTGQRHLR